MVRAIVPGGLPQQPAQPLKGLTGPIQLLTEQQAADAAGVHRKTIRRLIEQGRLKAADYGTARQHNYRIHPDDLARVAPIPAPKSVTPPVPSFRRHSNRQSAARGRVAVW